MQIRPRAHVLATGFVLTAIAMMARPAQAQDAASPVYLTPPQAIVDILDATPFPNAIVSPDRRVVALLERRSMPSIAELARPMLRLAGRRINPRTNGPQRSSGIVAVTLKTLGDGSEVTVDAPAGADIDAVHFSPDGARLAYTITREDGIELWIADVSTGTGRAVTDASLNAVWGDPCDWADEGALLCSFIAGNRGGAPAEPAAPTGPNIQEHAGIVAPVRTYQDLLRNAHDEALFEYHFTRQLATVDAATGDRTPIGSAGLYEEVVLAPNGDYLLVSRLKRPYSRLVPSRSFPKAIEIWSRTGEVVRQIADLPLADAVPIGGVPVGPRRHVWNPTEPATVVWAEAQDGGDPKASVAHRDYVFSLTAPFDTDADELARTEFRFSDVLWTEDGTALVRADDRVTRGTRTWLLADGEPPRLVWDRNSQDVYGDPGRPVAQPLGHATSAFSSDPRQVIQQDGNAIYLTERGASPQGDRPFLDRLDLATLETERLFHTEEGSYETVVALLSDDGTSILTRHETQVDPPNYVVRDTRAGTTRRLTDFQDPAPQLTGIEKRLITYERNDGVTLSGTLYLPPGYRDGERVPTLMWAYPREFTTADSAGQVRGSPHRFTTIRGPSHLLLLTQGYAIFDNPTMPIIGAGETANDGYINQLVANAAAAVDKVVELGVADRHRIGIGGHSYGAFMAANLLAHSDLFSAGIARSGAYNRTLTPFGFQSERRTFWQVPEVYAMMSPFFHAPQVDEPILLIHGEMDNNSGTFPIQSQRFYMALKGHGGTVRYVTLPNESHGYAARESVLHTVAEMLNWSERYVKNALPPTTNDQAVRR